MKRRSFLAALAGVIAAGRAAPAVLSKLLAPPPIAEAGNVVYGPHQTLQQLYRKMHGDLLKSFTSMSPEWDLFDDAPLSARLTHRSSGFGAWERRVLG